MGARDVGPWVGDPKPLGKTPFGGNPSPDLIYLPTYLVLIFAQRLRFGKRRRHRLTKAKMQ